jgi:16S rRNA (uracil1498-N3)-methyltransferase
MGGDGVYMPRFFIKPEDIQGGNIIITGEDVNHIRNVLRLRQGEELVLSDGKGTDYTVVLERFDPGSIVSAITGSRKNASEPQIEVTLFQGLPKSDKMDFIIQKGIELGVNRIVPVLTERTVVRIDNPKDADNKVTRWQRIALEAAKQCSRGRVPIVEHPVIFPEALKLAEEAQLRLIPYEKETGSGLKQYLKNRNFSRIAVFIGPEGGFSEKEVEKAILAGISPITLGPRILRTETAGIAVLSILMYELGDVGG